MLVGNKGGLNELYHNDGGDSFTSMVRKEPTSAYGDTHSVVFGDVDNDVSATWLYHVIPTRGTSRRPTRCSAPLCCSCRYSKVTNYPTLPLLLPTSFRAMPTSLSAKRAPQVPRTSSSLSTPARRAVMPSESRASPAPATRPALTRRWTSAKSARPTRSAAPTAASGAQLA